MESTVDILRLTQITKKAKDISIPNVPSQKEYQLIYEENKGLKEKIAKLSREQSSEQSSSTEIVLDDSSLSSLQQKMRLVEEAAQKAKESSQSFAAAADRWRSHRKLSRTAKVRKLFEELQKM
jgi:protease II